MSRTLSKLALIPVALLVCAPVAAQAQPASPDTPTAARAEVAKPLLQQDRDYYFTNVAPAVEDASRRGSAGRRRGPGGKPSKANEPSKAKRSATTGFPPAAKQLARREALATTKDISPRKTARAGRARPNVQRAKLLTLLVEFNPNANDDFSGWERPERPPTRPASASPSRPARCSTGRCTTRCPTRPPSAGAPTTTPSGCPTSRRSFYQQADLLHQGRPAADPQGPQRRDQHPQPDGQELLPRGVQGPLRASSGDVSPWLTLPHSEAWYSADSCEAGEASDVGHPDNPLGTGQMAIDAVEALAAAQPGLPLGRLRRRGPGRPRRRRQPVRAGRRAGPRDRAARRQGPGRRRRRRGHLRGVVLEPGGRRGDRRV